MRNLTIAAALLMSSTSLLAQTAQPTSATATATTAPQASAAGTADTMAGEAATVTTTPTTNSPTAVGASATAEADADATMSSAPAATAAAAPVATPSPSPADTAAAETIGGGASANGAATVSAQAAPVVMAAPVATASADWSSFDGDKDGALSPLEFAMHVDAANSALTAEAKRERYSRASGNGAIKLLNATADDFSKADKNQDRKVDSTELAGWQSGGASASAAPVAVTSGAGVMTPMPDATSDMAAPADTGTTVAPPDASDAPEGQKADDTMATDTPPTN